MKAVACGGSFAKEPMAGVPPIESMLAERYRPDWPPASGRHSPLGPLRIRGFPQLLRERLHARERVPRGRTNRGAPCPRLLGKEGHHGPSARPRRIAVPPTSQRV